MSVDAKIQIPTGVDTCEIRFGNKRVTLTNLQKIFWPELGKTKRDLLAYYAAVAPTLLPHLKDRALVMKRYPNGIASPFFFMKRTPEYRPAWLNTCPIRHRAGNILDFPMAQDLPSLLWMVNLGCIDLNPWYAECDDTDKPDVLHFDLDPVPPAEFREVRRAALLIRAYLDERKISSLAKTTGSRGIHVYVPIYRKQVQKEVWKVAKRIANDMAKQHPDELTSEYRIAKRPEGRVLVDYNQNAWGRTLASVYSVRPHPSATVSAPVSWEELEGGISAADLTIDSVPERVAKLGDLFRPMVQDRRRHTLEAFI